MKTYPVYIILSFWMIYNSCNSGANSMKPKDSKDPKNSIRDLGRIQANQNMVNEPINQVVGIAEIQPEKQIIPISSEIAGVVSKIQKQENDSVKTGETILELKHSIEDAKVAQLGDEVKTQINQVKSDKYSIEEFQAKYTNAVTEINRLKDLVQKGSETQQNLDNAQTNLLSYQSNLNRLKNNVLVSRSKLQETEASLEVSKKEREQKIIRSPVNGKILEIVPILGTTVDNKSSFGQIAPYGKTIALGEIDELFASRVKEGQRAWVRNLGSLDTLSTGTVYFTSSFLKKKSLFTDQAGEKEDRRVREIKIVIDQPEKLLLNARMECVVDVSNRSN